MKIFMGAFLVTVLFFLTRLGKKINEPFENGNVKTIDVLLDLPLRDTIQAEHLNYGDLVKYEFRTPLQSYEQITNNKKWTTPENGSALFPPINGMSLYKCGCQSARFL